MQPRRIAWLVALSLSTLTLTVTLRSTGASAQTPRPIIPPPRDTQSVTIPGSVVISPGQAARLVSPRSPSPQFPLVESVLVINQSDQPATVSHGGSELTVALPTGFAVRIIALLAWFAPCALAPGQPHVLRCQVRPSNPTPTLNFVGDRFTTVESVVLESGCTNVTLTWPDRTFLGAVAAAVMPESALIAIWRYEPLSGRFHGWSPLPGAPNDLTALYGLDTLFLCLRAPGTLARPVIEP